MNVWLIEMIPFVDVNECINDPCNNGGTCLNTDGSYKCKCLEGWQGHDCEEGE